MKYIARFSVLVAVIIWLAGMGFAISCFPDGVSRGLSALFLTAIGAGIIVWGNSYNKSHMNLPEDNSTTRT